MAFWRKKNWEDEYDEYYAQDRRLGAEKNPNALTRLRFFTHGLLLLFLGGIFLAAVGAISGPTMLEKMLTELAMPLGLVWLALMGMIYFCLLTRQAWPALVGFACWLLLTIAGNGFVSNGLVSTLERPYQNTDVFEMEPLDTIVVLGGGTSSRLNGGSQLSAGGDRVATAARLYHAGKTKHLVCTGTQTFRSSEKDLHPREEARAILIQLDVPSEAIAQMKGNNTFEEMKNLKQWLDENPSQGQTGRLGILTSAYHLSRAMRLAHANGIEAVPVPSDFLTHPNDPSPNFVVPGAAPMETTRRALKEYFARWVGR